MCELRVSKNRMIKISKFFSNSVLIDWNGNAKNYSQYKFQVVDPNGRKYVFKCNCWLTTLKYKRLIELSEIVGERTGDLGSDESLSLSGRHGRVFPLTITILFLLLVLITFTYFGNEICRKWRENFLFFASSEPFLNLFDLLVHLFITF